MKKIFFIGIITLLLLLKASANHKEIEQAIFDSRPQKLEELLNKTTLTELEIKNFVILAEQRQKMRTSRWGENALPGEPYAIAGGATSMLSIIMLGAYAMYYLDPYLRKSKQNEPFNYPFAITTGGLVAISLSLFYLAYKESQKPGWRSKADEEWDAFKVKLVLLNFVEQNTTLLKQPNANQ